MTCAACARRVEKALSKTAGACAANVTLAAEKATEEYADCHPLGAHDYAPAMLVLMLGMVYTFLRRETQSRDAFPATRRTGSLPTTRISHLPRGASPPLSQVFRL